MVSLFTIYDLSFLVLFTLGVVIFLYKHRKNLKRQGPIYLYRTKIGIKFIDYFAKKFSGILKPMQYVAVSCGYILMVSMVYLIIKFAIIYLSSSEAVRALKVPVIIPLIPYLPELFKIDYLPSFSFTYWIIIIAIIAVLHEFAHGIFARLNKIKIHSTGFGFLGPFLAAFVEPDEKHMKKAGIFPQLSVLAAGTFANVLSAILFGAILILFFVSSFSPSGVYFNSYSFSGISVDDIEQVNGVSLNEIGLVNLSLPIVNLTANGKTYFANPQAIISALSSENLSVLVYDDSPAFRAGIEGAISSVNGEDVSSYSQLGEIIRSYSPGDTVQINTIIQEGPRDEPQIKEYSITLSERDGYAFLGIGRRPISYSGTFGFFYSLLAKIKDPFTYYSSSLGSFGWFIYYLLWWLALISISVALANMLPVAIFDGGQFFYLTILGITKSKKIAGKLFSASTWLLIGLVIALTLKWVFVYI